MAETTDPDAEPIVVEFRDRDHPEFKKPDHDPHGEVPALAARSSKRCDGDGCRTSGLVLTDTLDHAAGYVDGKEREVLCKDCAKARGLESATAGASR
jgi:hypothetical protein